MLPGDHPDEHGDHPLPDRRDAARGVGLAEQAVQLRVVVVDVGRQGGAKVRPASVTSSRYFAPVSRAMSFPRAASPRPTETSGAT
ncbi:hypothetical protein B5P19_12060 [Clavibacter sepedonicus]|nr:hypothetical protein B5P19_12060 [Clavibacter sepedonicus]OQJ53790.1 hypothetical protein B5P20_06390 [Clavibacter sepedonicus]